MQTVSVLAGPPGSGKSHLMRENAIAQPGHYLVAVPTTWLANEQRDDYANAHPALRLFLIHHLNGQLGTVARQFEEAQEQIAAEGLRHAVMFITHESLLTLDLSNLSNWHVIIDEVPHVVRSGTFSVPLSTDYFSSRYDLIQCSGIGWSRVEPRVAAAPWHVSKRDSIASEIAEFDQESRRPHGLIVNAETWGDVANRGSLEWMSIWTPASLAHCASVTIAGAGFFNSLAYRAAEWLHPDIRFATQPVPARARSVTPTLRLHYFVEGHRGSCSYWATTEGRRVLAPIRQFLADIPDLGFWSGNRVVEQQFDTMLPADRHVRPKVAGSNLYAGQTSCAFIYSAQAVPEDRPLRLLGLGKAEIEQSREFGDLYQFVMRGLLRDPTFGGVFDAYVYSRSQADEIARRATEDGVAMVEMVPHPEVGVMDVIRGKPRRKPTPNEIESKRLAEREKDRLRKLAKRREDAKAAGRTGKPGRPRKHLVPRQAEDRP